MTDPELSTRVYVEPLTPEFLERIIETEKPDALLPDDGRPDGAEPHARVAPAREFSRSMV